MEYAVIGLGRFGSSLAVELQAYGNSVVAIDVNENSCKAISEFVDNTLILDATDEKAIKEASLHHIETIIVGMGEASITNSLLTCLILKSVGVKNVIAKAASAEHAKILQKIGVDLVVRPEFDMGKRLAKKLQSTSILDYVEISDEIRMDGIQVAGSCNTLANRSIYDVNLRKNYGINIICIKRGKELIIPESNTMILENDVLLVVGENKKVDKFEFEIGLQKK